MTPEQSAQAIQRMVRSRKHRYALKVTNQVLGKRQRAGIALGRRLLQRLQDDGIQVTAGGRNEQAILGHALGDDRI